MIFVHPPSHDFDDNWPTGWKWNDVASAADSFYARNPGTTTPSLDGAHYDNAAYDIMGDYLSSIGYEAVDAIEQPDLKNATFSYPPSNIINGERAGPLVSYYPLAKNMTNFSLQLYTKVLRVVRDGSKITGVEVENVNTGVRSIINIACDGRVVLAAGAMSTPAILINSGIGPPDQIQIVANGTTNITLPARQDWIELPVGTQIKDHPIVSVNFNTSASLNMTLYPFAAPYAADQESYLANKTGVLSQGYQRIVFWNSFVGSDGRKRYVQGTTGVAIDNQLSIKLYLTHGLTSVGQLGMAANGSTVFITSPYFQDPVDAQGLESFITNFTNQVISSSSTLTPATNLTAAEMLTADFAVGDHFVGTTKMGENDGTSVVDTNTKVYGTDNLFVVDASIHPDLPTGNTQAIIMVVAERASQLIAAL
jgi:cellobiose dehydrogenase (acceptor)